MIDTPEYADEVTEHLPLIVDDAVLVRDPNPDERALCSFFFCQPRQTLELWQSMTASIGVDKPGQRAADVLIQDERHRMFIRTVLEMIKAGYDEITFFDMVKNFATPERIEKMGGVPYLTRHSDFALVGGVNLRHHIEQLVDRYRLRKFQEIAENALYVAVDGKSLNGVIDDIAQRTKTLLKANTAVLTPTIDVCLDAMERLTMEEGDDGTIPSSFRHLAENVGNHRRTYMWLVGAPPGNGKTAFAMQEIQCALEHGFTVDAFLMESSFDQFMERYLMRNFAIRGGKFKSKFFTKDERAAIMTGAENLQKFEGRFHMAPPMSYNASQIDALIQERKQKTGTPCDLIVVDHLDKMAASRKDVGVASFDSTKENVQALSNIAARENAALLLLSQLSVSAIRDSFQKNSRIPTLGAFRGGTSTEYAKVCLILFKDEQEMLKNDSPVVEQEIVICKANDGNSGTIPSLFIKPLAMHIEDAASVERAKYQRHFEAVNWDSTQKRGSKR